MERWFAALTEKQLRRSTRELEAAVYHYTAETSKDAKPFIWTKTAEQIPASIALFCQRTPDSGH